MPDYNKIANGDIATCRFVKLDTTSPGRVLQATAGSRVYGISGPDKRFAPYTPLDDGLHRKVNEPCTIYGPGDNKAQLEIAGTVTAGDRLKSDADGKGVTTTTANDEVGAIADTSGTAGQLIWVTPVEPDKL